MMKLFKRKIENSQHNNGKVSTKKNDSKISTSELYRKYIALKFFEFQLPFWIEIIF